MALANQLGELQQRRLAVRAVHQLQAGSAPDEVLSIWCDHIDSMLPGGEGEATTAAQLEATAKMKAQKESLDSGGKL